MRGVGRFGPLKERPFRLLWLARTGSSIGDSLVPVALAFAVIDMHGAALDLGIVLGARTIALGTSTIAGGVWADRLPRRAVMISADLLRFATEAMTAALLFQGTAQVWQLALLQSAAGVGAGFFGPAATALLPQAVSTGNLQKANSLLSMAESGTRIFGPALSGLIVAAAGAGWCFAIDSASFLVSAGFVTAMEVAAHVRPVRQRFWHEVAEGWQEVRSHRWLTAGFLGFALGNVGIGIYLVLGPFVANEDLGGAFAWGLIILAVPVGGLLGGIVAYRIRPTHPVATAFAIWSLAAVLPFALVRPLPLAAIMVSSAVLGACLLIGNALWETAMQQEVRPDRLARVASIDMLLSVGLMPIGQALAGALAAGMGLRETLLLAGMLMCVPNLFVVAFVREVRNLRRRDEPEPALSAL
ncbi:MAG TPA: MFS transporter [Gaiellaceae bacterium]|nr:MFS transporter [Gaiellaceae bacterium]